MLQTQSALHASIAILQLESGIFMDKLGLVFQQCSAYTTLMTLMDHLHVYAMSHQSILLPIVIQALEIVSLFTENSNKFEANVPQDWISKEMLKIMPTLVQVKHHENIFFHGKIVKTFSSKFVDVIKNHPSAYVQAELVNITGKLCLHQLDEVLGQDMRRLLSVLHGGDKLSPDGWFQWRQQLEDKTSQLLSLCSSLRHIIGMALPLSSASVALVMTIEESWKKNVIDLIVRSVLYFYNPTLQKFQHEVLTASKRILQGLLRLLLALKKSFSSPSAEKGTNNSNTILQENVLNMRLWLALFIWRCKLGIGLDLGIGLEDSLQDLLEELAQHTSPITFSRILCNASTSKKKQSDIVDELFENDNDLVSLQALTSEYA